MSQTVCRALSESLSLPVFLGVASAALAFFADTGVLGAGAASRALFLLVSAFLINKK